MIDQTFDPSNDNELDTTPPPSAAVGAPSTTPNNPVPSSSSTSTPVPPSVDIRQVSLDAVPMDLTLAQSQEGTRAKIAWTFTLLFLSLITISVIGPFALYFLQPPNFQNPVEITKQLLTLISSVLAGPFGFIVGFYFKQGQTTES